MIRSFSSSPMCIKLCVFLHIGRSNFKELRHKFFELTRSFEFEKERVFWTPCIVTNKNPSYGISMVMSIY